MQYCWDQGGYLAEIMSVQEELLLDTFLMDGTSYWLGLTDLAQEGGNKIIYIHLLYIGYGPLKLLAKRKY